jgi:uncharacterized protein (DUF2384 family)
MATHAPIEQKSSIGAAGLRAFFRIAELWRLTNDQQIKLLNVPESTFFSWKKNQEHKRVSKDTLERISYVLGIYKNLQILLSDKDSACEWVSKPNKAPLFGGRSAIERMAGGNISDLYEVRRYLDAQVRG